MKKEKIQLKAQKRDVFGKSLDKFRGEGKLPAVLYGPKQESAPIFVRFSEFKKAWKEAGESAMIEMEIEGKKKPVLIYDVDIEPVSHEVRHADFYVVDLKKKIIASVPLVFTGESLVVKNLGGVLVKVIHDVEVESLPEDLPREIEVSLSVLKTFEDKITADDLKLPDNTKILIGGEEIIALVEEPKEEEKITEGEKIDMASIEVTKEKGKEEKESDTKNEDEKEKGQN